MTWLAVTGFFTKAWHWLKANWKVPLALIYTLVVWVLARGNINAAKDVLAARKKAHKDEVESLKKNHKEELQLRDESLKKYQEAMLRIEEEFLKRGEQLEEAHRERVREIASEDPDKVRERVEKEFGFKYVEMD